MKTINRFKRCTVFLLILSLALSMQAGALAAPDKAAEKALQKTAGYVLEKAVAGENLGYESEWLILALARSGCDADQEYFEEYYRNVSSYVKNCGGVLHNLKYTEYARVILAVTAAGYDATDVAGYDLTLPLGDFQGTIRQGINGAIWALIALDSGCYPVPKNENAAVQATRAMYVEEILNRQLSSGGFALSGTAGDPDITAMALQALSKYTSRSDVKAAVSKAVSCLSDMQNSRGGFTSWGEENLESCAQAVIALSTLGIDHNDKRFVKNGCTLLDNLLTYALPNGAFQHRANGGENAIATEQALCALTAYVRSESGKTGIYDMRGYGEEAVFRDIKGHKNQKEIETLYKAGVINGMGDGTFGPDHTMTRAQFATIVVKGLGLAPNAVGVFSDVAESAWYAGYIGTAYSCGIIAGRSDTVFDPEGTITVVEAKIMLSRAAYMLGLIDCPNEEWHYSKIMIKRCEIAEKLYGLLDTAGLFEG